MYRYRDNSGSTSRSLVAAKRHLSKVGKIHTIRGYVYYGKYSTNHVAVLVKGENGSARFSGFSWGYSGEGVRGLRQLLNSLSIDGQEIDRVIESSWDGWSKLGEVWKIEVENQ